MKITEREDYELFNMFVEFIEETCNPTLAKKYRDKFNEKIGIKLKKEYKLLTSNLNIIEKIDEDFKTNIEDILIQKKILEDAKQTREFILKQSYKEEKIIDKKEEVKILENKVLVNEEDKIENEKEENL